MSLDVQLDLGPHLDDTVRTPLEPYEDVYAAGEAADREPRSGSGGEPRSSQPDPEPASVAIRAAVEAERGPLEDRLMAAGVADAELRVGIVATDGSVEVRLTLHNPHGRLDANRQDVSIEQAVTGAFRELRHRLETAPERVGGEDAAATSPWAIIADSVHRYAFHEVEKQRRDGLPLEGVDARDLAGRALAMGLDTGVPQDPAVTLPRLHRLVDEFVAAALVPDPRPDAPLADEHPVPSPDDVAVADEERRRLTEVLFSLPDDDRRLFAETVIDALPVEWAALAREETPEGIETRLLGITDALERRFEDGRESILRRYRDLGHTLRNERLAAARDATFEAPPS